MPVYYGGDLNDLDFESVGDHDLDTWEDWCDSDLRNRCYGFCPDTKDAQPLIIFSPQVFQVEDKSQVTSPAGLLGCVCIRIAGYPQSSGDISAA